MTPSGAPFRAAVLCLVLMGSAALAQPTDETEPDTPRSTFADVIPDFANTTSPEEMQAVILKGIGSDDPETVEHTLRQIGAIAMLGTVEVEAIATFGDRAKPHLDRLLDLREELEAYVADEGDLLALGSWRKRSITETITSLAAELETLDDY